MSPTFVAKQVILVNRLAYMFHTPKVKDIVVLRDPRNNQEILKRITKIKENTYFVEGDNQNESTDSRAFGWVKGDAIIGKVISKK